MVVFAPVWVLCAMTAIVVCWALGRMDWPSLMTLTAKLPFRGWPAMTEAGMEVEMRDPVMSGLPAPAVVPLTAKE